MADNMEGGSNSFMGIGRHPDERAHTMDEGSINARDGSRVRFSQDFDRPNVVSVSATSIPGSENHNPFISRGNSGRRSASPSSPNSSRVRDGGYSLRKALFTRGVNDQTDNGTIELVEAGSSADAGRGTTGTRNSGGARSSKKQPSVNVSPVDGNDATEPSTILSVSDADSVYGRDKKSLGTFHLPRYDLLAKKRAKKNKTFLKLQALWRRIQDGKPIPPSLDGRHIDIDASRTKPLVDERTGRRYIGNAIRSSRYTLWNFFPRQLFFQFSKLANAYFLLISIMQLVPGWSTTGNYTTIIPLILFVFISMAKEGYDDVRRYRLDQGENNSITLVLRANYYSDESPPNPGQNESVPSSFGSRAQFNLGRGVQKNHQTIPSNAESFTINVPDDAPNHWVPTKWWDVKVGDIIKLKRDDPIPADIVLLHSDGPNGVAYIETMALDGETNLKSKQPPTSLAKLCRTDEEIMSCRASIVVEDPNIDLYNFDGRVTVDGETLPLTTNEVVFRGSTLRNTTAAIGMVINSGEECKIRMNANKSPRIKAPAMQNITNKIVLMLVLFVIILALFCTVGYQIWSRNVEKRLWYLSHAHVPFVHIIVGFIILYNTLIPLSLYVSMEIIKIFQLFFMADVEMYDPVTNTPMVCNTTTILENLGQVDYIFSDKTGTLTDNVMRFRKISVAGYAWLHDLDLQSEAVKLEESQFKKNPTRKGKDVAFYENKGSESMLDDQATSAASSIAPDRMNSIRRNSSVWKSSARPFKTQTEFRTEDLLAFFQHKPHSAFTKKARFFLLGMALCHTCLPEVKADGHIDFQAASPDELALIQAAQDLGWLVVDRAARSITLNYPAGGDTDETITEVYEILDVIEFSSKRKRMSIIVKFPSGKICILCKGADSAILPRLRLAPLAIQKKTEVFRKASVRKSLEAEQAMRRMSSQSPRTSLNLGRPAPSFSAVRKSIGNGRPSVASTRLEPIRDELDSRLTERERDNKEFVSEDSNTLHLPRASTSKISHTSGEHNELDVDDFVDEAVVQDEALLFERCFQHIDEFASEGLRTLLFGYKFLDDHEYAAWKKVYLDATTSLVDRQHLIESAGEMIEQGFELSGATGIEDRLQKGVPETIDKLRRANIKIWMLTGDKRETAINIAHSARICKNYSEVIVLDHTKGGVMQLMASMLIDIKARVFPHTVVVIDGQTLTAIDSNETSRALFFDLAIEVDSVICCRASPSQKARLVRHVRTKIKKSITLAIGDGANDIAMIQEAHVGIGISGKEGLQAARIADYSIAQFRFLQKLLFVHGRWNYVRTGRYILATFWKELMFYLIQALYQHWTGYTGISLFESTSLTVFNTLFTSLPVIFLGILEQDLNARTLLAVPELYVMGQRNEGFSIGKYFAWMFMAVCECMIIYFTMLLCYGEAVFSRDNNLLSMGTLCFTGAVVFINTKLLIIEKHNKTYLTGLAWFITVAGWFVWQLFLSGVAVSSHKYWFLYPMKFSFIKGFGRDLLWWMTLILMITCLMIFELGIKSIQKAFWPSDTDVFQRLQKDPVVQRVFDEILRKEQEGDAYGALGVVGQPPPPDFDGNGKGKSSYDHEQRRESELSISQGLSRGYRSTTEPRPKFNYHVSFGGENENPNDHREDDGSGVIRSPVDVEGSNSGAFQFGFAKRSGSIKNLTRRKVSVDVDVHGPGGAPAGFGFDGVGDIELVSPMGSRKTSVVDRHY